MLGGACIVKCLSLRLSDEHKRLVKVLETSDMSIGKLKHLAWWAYYDVVDSQGQE